jgi:CRISPR-associated protein Cas2
MSHYIAAYDIADDRQREKVAKVLHHYGIRIQRSIFIVDLEPQDLDELPAELGKLLGESDLLDIVPIAESNQRPHLRWNVNRESLQDCVVVD